MFRFFSDADLKQTDNALTLNLKFKNYVSVLDACLDEPLKQIIGNFCVEARDIAEKFATILSELWRDPEMKHDIGPVLKKIQDLRWDSPPPHVGVSVTTQV